jgi:hypothetical protein
VILVLEDQVSRQTERWLMVMGALYIVLVLAAPRGLVGEVRRLLGRGQRRRAEEGRIAAAEHDEVDQMALTAQDERDV